MKTLMNHPFTKASWLFAIVAGAVLLATSAGTSTEKRGGQPLGPGLVGTWYWETSTYISVGDYSDLIKSVEWFRIFPNGRYTLQIQGTHTGTKQITGQIIQLGGNSLKMVPDNGNPFNVNYRLTGNNGLWLNGRLYEKK